MGDEVGGLSGQGGARIGSDYGGPVESGESDRLGVEARRQLQVLKDFNNSLVNRLGGDVKPGQLREAFQRIASLPSPAMDPDTAVVILMDMVDKKGQADLRNAMKLLKTTLQQSADMHKARMEKYDAQVKKAKEAREAQEKAQVASDVGLGFQVAGSVLAMLGAILLTVFTLGGGAAAIVGAAIGLTQTVLDVGTRIAKATGATYTRADGKAQEALDITIGGTIKRAIEQQEANGHLYPENVKSDKEKADYKQKYTMGWTIAMNLLVAAGSIAAGGASFFGVGGKVAGLGKEASSLTAKLTASFVAKTAELFEATAQVGSGAASISQAGYGMQIADLNFQKNEIDNQRTRMDSWQSILSNDIQSYQEHLAKAVKSHDAMYEQASNVVADFHRSQSKLVKSV